MYEEAFLEDICQHPEDLAPRLAFADWLMEQGHQQAEVRGEFIALQCELASGTASRERRRTLRQRERELLALYGEMWAGWTGLLSVVNSYTFRRGFIEAISIDLVTFVLQGEELLRQAPLTEVLLTGALDADLSGLTEITVLRNIHTLRLSGRLTANGLRVLASSSHLQRLTTLDLTGNSIGDEGLGVLSKAPFLGQLTTLVLSRTGVQPAGVRELMLNLCEHAHSQGKWHLKKLRLNANPRLNLIEARNLLASLAPVVSQEDRRHMESLFSSLEGQFRRRVLERVPQQRTVLDAGVLSRCLTHSHKKVRQLASRRLAEHPARASQEVANLLRRHYEGCNALSALQRAREHLTPSRRNWVTYFLRHETAEAALEKAWLNIHPMLPRPVLEEFAALCARRREWWAGHAAKSRDVPHPAPLEAAEEEGSTWPIRAVLQLAENARTRRMPNQGQVQAGTAWEVVRKVEQGKDAARRKEASWLLSWLYRLLEQHEARTGS